MAEIKLTQGKVAVVDDEDFEYLNQFKWFAHEKRKGEFYAARNLPRSRGRLRKISMHRFILGLTSEDGGEVDHINRNKLDNQRRNLRQCIHAQNMKNCKTNWGRSKYRGVCWDKVKNKWMAKIQNNGVTKFLGYFKLEQLAALAYDFAALKYHREFANFNF